MTTAPHPDSGRPMLCESLSLIRPSVTGGSDGALSPDDYVQCSNDVAAHCRLLPDAGEPVDVWLCTAHVREYDRHIVEVLDAVDASPSRAPQPESHP